MMVFSVGSSGPGYTAAAVSPRPENPSWKPRKQRKGKDEMANMGVSADPDPPFGSNLRKGRTKCTSLAPDSYVCIPSVCFMPALLSSSASKVMK